VVRGRLIFALVFVAGPALAGALDLELGKSLFERSWISAPASTTSDDGLGPLYDARSCFSCHAREAFPREDRPVMVVRLGNAQGGGDPVYGHQLQRNALRAVAPEGQAAITWNDAGGLRRPVLSLSALGYGPLAPATRAASRRPIDLAGVGSLARIPQREILRRANPEGQGVSGRAAWITDAAGRKRLGRFGWKATQPDLTGQTDMAFSRDLGMSTRGQGDPTGECSVAEIACRSAPHGAAPGEPEISDTFRDLLVAYLEELPPPNAATVSATRGANLFGQTGCADCHATMTGADGRPVRAFTDLLLHDMGPGLDDGIAEGAASPREWRTAPLWGLSAHPKSAGLLHDGRARNVAEAIGWHDGEARAARARFRALAEADKTALLAFVNGL
jgi:CxxC motif-containing protein (DUF1111 family)